MKKVLLLITCLIAIQATAQEEKLRITLNSDEFLPIEMPSIELNVNDIEEISFHQDNYPLRIEGEWFDDEEDVFQSLSFFGDGTVNHYYHYKNFPLHGNESGLYLFLYDIFEIGLTLWGDVLCLPVVNHTESSFTWRFNGNNRTYYRVQNVYEMTLGDNPISIGNEDDVITYVDNVFVGLENGKVKPLNAGSGFVLVKNSKLGETTAYRINVKESNCIIDWTQYFEKTKTEVLAEFGDSYRESSNWITYTGEDESTYKYIAFYFDESGEKVEAVSITFNQYDCFQSNYNYIKTNYVFNNNKGSNTNLYFFDTDNILTSTVGIIIDITNMNVSYSDLKHE